MKKKIFFLILCVLCMVAVCITLYGKGATIRPYENLQNSQIQKIDVRITPPSQNITLNDRVQVDEIVGLLKDIEISKYPSAKPTSDGQICAFTLYFYDGTRESFSLNESLFIFNSNSHNFTNSAGMYIQDKVNSYLEQ